jgi:hypothetical protein
MELRNEKIGGIRDRPYLPDATFARRRSSRCALRKIKIVQAIKALRIGGLWL